MAIRPAECAGLAPDVQLVPSHPVEAGRPNRLDFLLAGFGWRRMPRPRVAAPLAAGRLVKIDLAEDSTPAAGLTIQAATPRDRAPGRALAARRPAAIDLSG